MDSEDVLAPLPIPPRKPQPEESRKKRSEPGHSSKGRERSTRDLLRLLIHTERDLNDLRSALNTVNEQLRIERQRADDAEGKVIEVLTRLKDVNLARLVAVQDAARVKEELRLYKIQLERAQQEIFKAQDVLKIVDAQRCEAEENAAKARATARKLKEEKMVELAREEGRRIGLREGLERGRNMGYSQARRDGYAPQRRRRRQNESYYEYETEGRRTETETPDDYEYEHDHYDTNQSESAPDIEILPPSPSPPVPASPPHVTPTPIPTPRRPTYPDMVQPGGQIHPTPVHNIPPSPRHHHVNIPPEGFIPETGPDSVIRLPPPHEFTRPALSRSPSPPLPGIPEGDEDEPLIIPPPSRAHHSHNHRTFSPESNSTTLSQFEMVNDPRSTSHARRTPMTVIHEAASSHASPRPETVRQTPVSHRDPVMDGSPPHVPQIVLPMPAPPSAPVIPTGLESRAPHDPYRRSSLSSSDSSLHYAPSEQKKERRGSSSSSLNTVPDITIQPPSRPPSTTRGNNSSSTTVGRRDFLSPADANRPVDLPDRTPRGTDSQSPRAHSQSNSVLPSSASPPQATDPIVLPDGRLPPGFVPSVFTPSASIDPLLPPLGLFGGPANSHTVPGGYYDLDAQTPGSHHHAQSQPVIPDPTLYHNNNLDSESDDSDAYTLTTPPSRRARSTGKSSRSDAVRSSLGGAAGVPLPPSTVGGTSPGSGFGSVYGYARSHGGSNVGSAGR